MFFAALAGAQPAGDVAGRQSQMETVRSEIQSLNVEMQISIENYNQANSALDEIEKDIEENAVVLQETQANLQLSQERLEKRLVNIYRNGSVEVLDVLMETSDINEFMSKLDLLTMIGEQDRDDLEQIKQFKIQVEEAKAKLAEDEAKQSALLNELTAKKSQIEAGIAEKQQMVAGIESELAALEQSQRARDQEAAQAEFAGESSGGGYAAASYSGGGGDVVSIAMQFIGLPYVWGGSSPSGFDCSGLTQFVFGQAGISIPRTASAQQGAGSPVGRGELSPGDLVFFGSPAYHVGIYVGGGSMIHSPYPGSSVEVAPLMGDFSGGARF